ncbi:glycosyltransferase, partial [Nocardioides hankookensis]
MRITLVTETFFPAVDGTTTTVKAVVDRLVDTGHDVQLIAPGPGLATYRGCPVSRIRPLDRPGGQVRDALVAFRPDLVHVTSPRTVGRKALKHADRLGVPAVVVEQSPLL